MRVGAGNQPLENMNFVGNTVPNTSSFPGTFCFQGCKSHFIFCSSRLVSWSTYLFFEQESHPLKELVPIYGGQRDVEEEAVENGLWDPLER